MRYAYLMSVTLLRHHSSDVQLEASQDNSWPQQLPVLHLVTPNKGLCKCATRNVSDPNVIFKSVKSINESTQECHQHSVYWPGLLKTVPMSNLKWPTIFPCLKNVLSDITWKFYTWQILFSIYNFMRDQNTTNRWPTVKDIILSKSITGAMWKSNTKYWNIIFWLTFLSRFESIYLVVIWAICWFLNWSPLLGISNLEILTFIVWQILI